MAPAPPKVLVPTMGALHQGHAALIAAAARLGRVVVSIFVNPTQFGPHEDFERYPRDPEGDRAFAKEHGADEVWEPTVEEIYPAGPASAQEAGELGQILCGRSRPGHFDGVLTVVGRLFEMAEPAAAVFGEKDWQQLVLVRRLAAARGGPEILSVPTVRDGDGLAVSSRHRYLEPEQREEALALPRALAAVAALWGEGCRQAPLLERRGRESMGQAANNLDYLEVRPHSLLPRRQVFVGEAVALGAQRVGGVRLIDNTPLLP